MIKFLLLYIIISPIYASTCLENLEQDELGITLFKAEYICQRNLSLCQSIFNSKRVTSPVNKSITTPCLPSNSFEKHLTPLPIAFGVKKISDFYNLSQIRMNTLIDYYHHTKLHIARTEKLALALYDRFPEYFKHITREQIAALMPEHDFKKLSLDNMRGEAHFQALESDIGKRAGMDKVELLNHDDKGHMLRKMKELGLSKEAMKEFELLVERTSDIADRTMSPVSPHEFGRKMIKETVKPNHYFVHTNNLDLDKYMNMFKYLEDNYQRIIPDELIYKTPTKAKAQAIYKKIFIDPVLSAVLEGEEKLGKTKIPRFLLHMLMRRHNPKVANASMVRAINRKPLQTITRNTMAALSNPFVDFILLFGYHPSTGCTELGSHPWVQKDMKCIPVPGLSDEFLDNVVLQDHSNVIKDDNTCNVFKQNYLANQLPIFDEHICSKDSIKLKSGTKTNFDLGLDDQGRIRNFTVNKYDPRAWGELFKKVKLKSLSYNEKGDISEVCTFPTKHTNIGISKPGKCYKDIKDFNRRFPIFMREISSLNFKFNQVSSCCLGQTNFLNQEISCQK